MEEAAFAFIHQFAPAAANSAGPVLLLLHGTGGDEHDLLELGRSLAPGAPLLSPRGKILENGMPRFFRRLAEGVFDEADLIARTHELADFVAAANAHYGVASRPIVAVGFSNGANIAASMLLLRPEVLAGATLLHAMVPLIPAQLPDLAARPVFLAAGRVDPIIPPENTERLAAMLRAAGAEVTLHWSPGGHQITSPALADAQRWLHAHFPA